MQMDAFDRRLGRAHYRGLPTVTRGFGFRGLILSTGKFSNKQWDGQLRNGHFSELAHPFPLKLS